MQAEAATMHDQPSRAEREGRITNVQCLAMAECSIWVAPVLELTILAPICCDNYRNIFKTPPSDADRHGPRNVTISEMNTSLRGCVIN